jgi:hypothetical protein
MGEALARLVENAAIGTLSIIAIRAITRNRFFKFANLEECSDIFFSSIHMILPWGAYLKLPQSTLNYTEIYY